MVLLVPLLNQFRSNLQHGDQQRCRIFSNELCVLRCSRSGAWAVLELPGALVPLELACQVRSFKPCKRTRGVLLDPPTPSKEASKSRVSRPKHTRAASKTQRGLGFWLGGRHAGAKGSARDPPKAV